MLSIIVRFSKRFAVLVPGLVIAYLSIFNIFPELHERLPFVAAAIATYLLGSYVLIPALIRLARIIFPPNHLPLYCVTPDGFASDPLNIALIGSKAELIESMTTAGWFVADHHSLRNMLHEALSTIYGWSYPTAPMSSLFLFGRKQDIGFEIPIKDGAAGARHHVRFWATTYQEGELPHVHAIDWRHRQAHVQGDRLLWVGAASRDIGISYIRHNAQVTHMIDPDTNQERTLIERGLITANVAKKVHSIKLGDAYTVTNRVWRGYLQTDGNMSVLEVIPKLAD